MPSETKRLADALVDDFEDATMEFSDCDPQPPPLTYRDAEKKFMTAANGHILTRPVCAACLPNARIYAGLAR